MNFLGWPSWAEVVRVRRANKRLSEELKQSELENASLQRKLREREQEFGMVHADHVRLRARFDAQAKRVIDLERENGQVEARLASAMGRTFVVAQQDVEADLVTALVQVKERCEQAVRDDPHTLRFTRQGNPEVMQLEGRVRGIRGIAAAALLKAGVKEEAKKA